MEPGKLTPPPPSASPPLRIGGFLPFSATDYPGYLAAVVFCQGCPWRCAYCHNPHLLPAEGPESHDWHDILVFLGQRIGLLDAIVFSGGEPTLQAGLAAAMHKVKEMGFRIGLHTAGMYPERLARVLPLVDWVGLDVKGPLACYPRITGVPDSGPGVFESLALLHQAHVPHEIRCTWHPDLLAASDLARMADELQTLDADRLVVQVCQPAGRAGALAPIPPGRFADSGVQDLARRFAHFNLRPAA